MHFALTTIHRSIASSYPSAELILIFKSAFIDYDLHVLLLLLHSGIPTTTLETRQQRRGSRSSHFRSITSTEVQDIRRFFVLFVFQFHQFRYERRESVYIRVEVKKVGRSRTDHVRLIGSEKPTSNERESELFEAELEQEKERVV